MQISNYLMSKQIKKKKIHNYFKPIREIKLELCMGGSCNISRIYSYNLFGFYEIAEWLFPLKRYKKTK